MHVPASPPPAIFLLLIASLWVVPSVATAQASPTDMPSNAHSNGRR